MYKAMTNMFGVADKWDRNAESWTASMAAGHDQINELFGMPCYLNFLGDIANLEVLDAGCGEGRSSRHLASRGARVTGVDISGGMIANAISSNLRTGFEISYKVASCLDLGQFPDRHFDLVTSFMAMMDTPELPRALAEFHRVTKPGGRVAMMVRHPCFFTRGFSILKNGQGYRTMLTVSEYFRRRPYTERWKFRSKESSTFEVTRFPYTLSDYINAFVEHGFAITSVHEPQPSDEMCAQLPSLSFWRLHGALYLLLIGTRE